MINVALLTEILEAEEKVLQEMLVLEEQTRQVLINRKAKALEMLNEQKQQLALKMRELDARRVAAVPAGFTLKQYLEGESTCATARLEQLRRSLLELCTSLHSRQKVTRRLLLFNRQLAAEALRMLKHRGEEDLYSASGEKTPEKLLRTGLIDSNA